MDQNIMVALSSVSADQYEHLRKVFKDKIAEAAAILDEINSVKRAQDVGEIPKQSLSVLALSLEDFLRGDVQSDRRRRGDSSLTKRLLLGFKCQLAFSTPRVVDVIAYDRTFAPLSNVGTKSLAYLEEKLAEHGLRLGMLSPSWNKGSAEGRPNS